MKFRPLGRTGLNVSILGFGASSFGGVFRAVTAKECDETLQAALDGGINFIDVSPAYGGTLAELRLGRALAGIARDRYILATKIGSYSEARGDYDYSRASTERSIEHSMVRLGVDYLDLIQIHDIEFADTRQLIDETLPALQDLKRQGMVGHIGVTGLPLKMFPRLIEQVEPGTIETVLSFCHHALNDTSLLDIVPVLDAHGVGIINASPTGMGLLTSRGAPGWHPACPVIRETCARAAAHCAARGVDIVSLAVNFACGHPAIASTLVGSASAANMIANIAWAEAEPDPQLLAEVLAILAPIHNCNYTRGRAEHRDPIIEA